MIFSRAPVRELLHQLLVSLGVIVITRTTMFLAWGGHLPASISIPGIFLNMLFVLAPLSLLRLTLRPRFAFSLALLGGLALAYLNYSKILLLNNPLQLADLWVLQISPITMRYVGAKEGLSLSLLLLLPLLALACWRLSRATKDPVSWRARAAISSLLCGLFFFLYFGPGRSTVLLNFSDTGPIEEHMLRDGFWLANFARANAFRSEVPRVPGAAEILRELKASPALVGKERPDIVVILLESFHDLDNTGLTLEPGFLPHYRALRTKAAAFRMSSPVFGGVTANAEYEVLTGLPANVETLVSVPYMGAFTHEVPSVVGRLKKSGYETIALHNAERKFWNRDTVYRQLGFSSFLGIESLPARARDGTDTPIFRESLERLRETERAPSFQFLITLGTHGPFGFERPTSTLTKDWLLDKKHPELEKQVNDYAQRMQELDAELGAYFAELERLPRPPVVVLFGDHQPHFLHGLTQAPYEIDVTLFDGGKRNIPFSSTPPRDLYCLAPLLLRKAGAALPPYFVYLENFCQERGALSRLDEKNPEHARVRRELESLSLNRLWGAETDPD